MVKRKGFTIAETLAAVFILSAVMALTLQAVAAVRVQRSSLDQRLRASLIASNAMERLTALPAEQIDADALKSAGLADELPEGQLDVDVSQAEAMKRIAVTVSWRPAPEANRRSVRLVSFRGSKQEPKP